MRPDALQRSGGRIVIVGEDPLARDSVSVALGDPAAVVASLAPTAGVLDELARLAPDVVVWDLGPVPVADLSALRAASAAGHTVIALIAQDAQATEVLAAGAAGVHRRADAAARLPIALAAAAHGLVVLDEALKARLVGGRRSGEDGLPIEPLTPRERDVLALLAEGRSNRDIGVALGIAERTAKFHVNAILQKLDAEGRTEAVVRAARLGLIVL